MSMAVSPRALEQAADWLVRLQHDATAADRAACEQWRLSDPQHALSWERAERLLGKLGGLPPELARPAMIRADHRSDRRPGAPASPRRTAVVRIAALLAGVPAAWASWRYAQSQPWSAAWTGGIGTSVGQRRTVTLADGTVVTLNTASTRTTRRWPCSKARWPPRLPLPPPLAGRLWWCRPAARCACRAAPPA